MAALQAGRSQIASLRAPQPPWLGWPPPSASWSRQRWPARPRRTGSEGSGCLPQARGQLHEPSRWVSATGGPRWIAARAVRVPKPVSAATHNARADFETTSHADVSACGSTQQMKQKKDAAKEKGERGEEVGKAAAMRPSSVAATSSEYIVVSSQGMVWCELPLRASNQTLQWNVLRPRLGESGPSRCPKHRKSRNAARRRSCRHVIGPNGQN